MVAAVERVERLEGALADAQARIGALVRDAREAVEELRAAQEQR